MKELNDHEIESVAGGLDYLYLSITVLAITSTLGLVGFLAYKEKKYRKSLSPEELAKYDQQALEAAIMYTLINQGTNYPF